MGKIQKTIYLLTLIAIVSAIFYFVYLINPSNIDYVPLYIVFLASESFVIGHSLFVWWTILHYHNPPEVKIKNPKIKKEILTRLKGHTVDILIPAVSEPFEIIKETIIAAVEMEHEHNVYILDDKGRQDLKDLAKEYGVGYFHRNSNEFFKAGNVNNALSKTSGEFVVVFDADFVPRKDFLIKLLPHFEDPELALLQTPQYYRDGKSFTEQGALPIQNVFYELVMPGKNAFNSAFCVGTNVIYRRKALDTIGGLPKISHSEDVFTSYRLHEKHWKTLYIPEVMALGLAPDTIESYFKQQRRWAGGGFSMLIEHMPLFNKNLTLDQKVQYMSSAFYMSGFAIMVNVFLPILYLLFGVKPIHAYNNIEWLVHFLPFFLINFAIIIYAMGGLNLKSMALSISTFPIYVGSFIEIIIGKKFVWQVTNAARTKKVNYTVIYPHILLFTLGIIAIIVGSVNPIDPTTTIINMFWLSLYTSFFGIVIYEFFDENNSFDAVKIRWKNYKKSQLKGLTVKLD